MASAPGCCAASTTAILTTGESSFHSRGRKLGFNVCLASITHSVSFRRQEQYLGQYARHKSAHFRVAGRSCIQNKRVVVLCAVEGTAGAQISLNSEPKGSEVSVLERYLLGELLLPLLVGLAAFSLLAISIGSWHEVSLVLRGGAVRRAVAVLFLRTPALVGLAIPMATLLAPLLGFGQLNLNAESIALQACGVRKWRLVRLAGTLFLGVALLHLIIAEGFAPRTNRAATDIVTEARAVSSWQASSLPPAQSLRWGPVLHLEIRDGSLERLLYAQAGDGSVLSRPAVLEVQHAARQPFETVGGREEADISGRSGRRSGIWPKAVMTAEGAWWDGRIPGWRLREGKQHELLLSAAEDEAGDVQEEKADQVQITNYNVRQQATQEWPDRHEVDALRTHVGRSTDDLSMKQMLDMLHALRSSHINKDGRTIQLKLHQRIALPFASFVFGVLAAALSFRLPLQNKLVASGLTLGLVFLYYALSLTGSLLSQLLLIPPVMGAWLPNFIGAIVTALLMLG